MISTRFFCQLFEVDARPPHLIMPYFLGSKWAKHMAYYDVFKIAHIREEFLSDVMLGNTVRLNADY